MIEKIRGLCQKYKKGFGHLVKFQCVGVINFAVDYGVLTLLNSVLGWPVGIANTVSYSCGIINSFLFNRYWTFRIRLKFFSGYTLYIGQRKIRLKFFSVDFMKFIAINVLGWGINTLTMVILVNGYSLSAKSLGLFENFAPKLIATVFSFAVNFAGSKLLVFREDRRAQKIEPVAQDGEDRR
jgi:Predicted membrane protein